MGSKKKAPQVDPSQAIDAQKAALAYQERYTPTSQNYDSGGFGSTFSSFDPTTKQIKTSVNADPRIQKGLSDYLDSANNFDNDVNAEQQNTDVQVNDFIKSQINNLQGDLGPAGRASSKGGYYAGQFGKSLSYDAQNMREAARQRVVQRNQDRYNMFYQPYAVLAGSANPGMVNQNVAGLGAGGASTYNNMGQTYSNAANTNAQLRMQARMQPAPWQTAVGVLGGLGSSAIGAYTGGGR
jgi:hypothetical protein